MKPRGKKAWLITWEGPESIHLGRCKVVAILPPQRSGANIASLLPILFASEYNYTLGEKMRACASGRNDPLFKEAYRDVNPEFWYGHYMKAYLCARIVKNLRCEENRSDSFESTLCWTELPKFIPNPKYGPMGPLLEDLGNDDALKEIVGERDMSYTYSIRSAIDAERGRKGKR